MGDLDPKEREVLLEETLVLLDNQEHQERGDKMGDLDPKEREVCRERRGATAHLVPQDSLENMDHQVCLALLGTWEYQGSRGPRVTTVPWEASDLRERRERRERRGRREIEGMVCLVTQGDLDQLDQRVHLENQELEPKEPQVPLEPKEPQVPPLEGQCMFAGVGLCVPLTREPSWSTPGELGARRTTKQEAVQTISVCRTTQSTWRSPTGLGECLYVGWSTEQETMICSHQVDKTGTFPVHCVTSPHESL